MGVKIREKRKKLYLDIYQAGKRTWEALHLTLTTDKVQNKEILRLAEICRSKKETQLLAGEWNIQDPVASKQKLIAYLEAYTKHYTSPSIVKSCIHHLKHFKNGEQIQLAHITAPWIEAFQQYLLQDAELSQNSAAHYAKILRAALKKAASSGLILHNPAEPIPRIPEAETDMVFLALEELQRLAQVRFQDPYKAEVRRAFLFACHTGLRISDLETLTWDRIGHTPPQLYKQQTKTKQFVSVPLSKTAYQLIHDGQEPSPQDTVFTLPRQRRRYSYTVLKQWAQEAKVAKNIGWHTSRRTFATLAFESNVDIYTVSKLLGHTGLKQVAKYAKVTDKLKRAAVDALPEIEL